MSDQVSVQNSSKSSTKFGALALGIVATSSVGLIVATSSFILPAFRRICLPFLPATSAQVKNVVTAMHQPSKFGMTVVDIGSGDGRIVTTLAAHGFHATGFELNIWLLGYSKFQAWKKGLTSKAKFQHIDLWKADYSKFDNVVIFGVEEMMPELEKKLLDDLKIGSKIVACRFPLPSITPCNVVGSGVDTVWSYTVTQKCS